MVPLIRLLATRWRRPPAVYTGREEGIRHATWLELFFDLVFVVAIAEMGTNLHDDLGTMQLLNFAWLFLLVWWVWLAYSYYSDIFDTEDAVSRLALVTVMFLVIFLSQTIDGVLSGNSFPFTVGLVGLRGIIALLYLRERFEESEAGAFLTYWTGSEILSAVILVVSLFVPPPGRFGLWLAAFVINIGGVFVLYTVFEPVVVQVSHFPERLGLMTIIVLGETILAVAFGTSLVTPSGHIEFRSYLIGGAAFAIAVSTWWLYFERYDERFIDRILETHDDRWLQARQRGLTYVFSHYLVHIGIVAIGVGITVAIDAAVEGHALVGIGLLVLCAGVASFLVGSTVCHWMLSGRMDRRALAARLGVAAAVSWLPFFDPDVSPLVVVGAIALGLAGLILFEVWTSSGRDRGPPIEA